MLDALDHALYAPHVGSVFTVAGQQALELLSVEPDRRPRGGNAGRCPFALTFRGDAGAPLPQGLHELRHPVLGAGALFLVPIGPHGGGLRYEAIFN